MGQPERGPLMAVTTGSQQRRVLFVEDDASIRNVLYVLLARAGWEAQVAHSGEEALAVIAREQFDALMLDLRCVDLPTEETLTQIAQLSPSLVGRVLVITGEVTGPETMEVIARHCLPHVPRNRLIEDLWSSLQAVMTRSEAPKVAS